MTNPTIMLLARYNHYQRLFPNKLPINIGTNTFTSRCSARSAEDHRKKGVFLGALKLAGWFPPNELWLNGQSSSMA